MAAEAGYKPGEADNVTIDEIVIAIEAHGNMMLHDWRLTRVVAYTIAATNRDPKKSFPKIEKFMPLPGDKKAAGRDPRQIMEAHRKKLEKYPELNAGK